MRQLIEFIMEQFCLFRLVMFYVTKENMNMLFRGKFQKPKVLCYTNTDPFL